MKLYLYNENGEVSKAFDLSVGPNILGITRKRDLGILKRKTQGTGLVEINIAEQGGAEINDIGCNKALLVNNIKIRSSPLKAGDEIVVDDHLLVLAEPKKIKNYVLVDESKKPPLQISTEPDNMIISSLLNRTEVDEDFLQLIKSDSYALEKTHQQLSSLLKISQEINTTFDFQRLVCKIIDYLFEVLLIERAAVMLSDAQFHPLNARVAYRRGINETVRISRTIINTVLKDKLSVITSNALEDPRFRRGESVLEGQIHSAICVPMVHQDQVLGIIYVDSTNPAINFDSHDLRFLTILANITAVAIENVRKYNQLELELKGWMSGFEQEAFIIGKSSASRKVYDLIQRVANSSVTVLLIGESGTGKELTTRAIHQLSHRKDKPFVTINCATIPDNLMESELFGYERGAFTGAHTSKPGKFELASGGTIFLDEISEINLDLQSKLLRVVEGRGFQRVGGTRTIFPNARLIVATNRRLEQEVEAGRFRGDLYFRLNVFPIYLPALRERREDVIILARYFLHKFARENTRDIKDFDDEAQRWLLSYSWPGNIRELKNLIERAVLLCDGRYITKSMLFYPESVCLETHTVPVEKQLWQKEAEAIVDALQKTNWNKTRAARLLGISRHHLIYRMQKYKIEDKPT